MSKKQIVLIILLGVILSWIFNIFPGRQLAAKISTWPLLNSWKILSPLAPIVINKTETVRVSDSGDVMLAATAVKSKISLVLKVKNSNLAISGGAVNLTSDGVFVTAASAFPEKNDGDYFVLLNDGKQAAVTQRIVDPATSLVFFKAALSGVPTVSLGDSKSLVPGEKIIFIEHSLQNFYTKVTSSYVNFSQNDVSGQNLSSDLPRRSFGASAANLISGQAIANTSGEVVGLWNGGSIISSDVLKQALSDYLNTQQQIVRPMFGFSYTPISANQSRLTRLPEGVRVIDVTLGSSSQKAGLLAGDVITAVNDGKISEENSLEEIFQKHKPGDKLELNVMRGKQSLVLSLIVGELK